VAAVRRYSEALIAGLPFNAIYEAVSCCDAARPLALQATLQRFGLSGSLEGVSAALFSERIQSIQNSIRFCKR
jgi:hypothetical protein